MPNLREDVFRQVIEAVSDQRLDQLPCPVHVARQSAAPDQSADRERHAGPPTDRILVVVQGGGRIPKLDDRGAFGLEFSQLILVDDNRSQVRVVTRDQCLDGRKQFTGLGAFDPLAIERPHMGGLVLSVGEFNRLLKTPCRSLPVTLHQRKAGLLVRDRPTGRFPSNGVCPRPDLEFAKFAELPVSILGGGHSINRLGGAQTRDAKEGDPKPMRSRVERDCLAEVRCRLRQIARGRPIVDVCTAQQTCPRPQSGNESRRLAGALTDFLIELSHDLTAYGPSLGARQLLGGSVPTIDRLCVEAMPLLIVGTPRSLLV
jgi:hypothetical protein